MMLKDGRKDGEKMQFIGKGRKNDKKLNEIIFSSGLLLRESFSS